MENTRAFAGEKHPHIVKKKMEHGETESFEQQG